MTDGRRRAVPVRRQEPRSSPVDAFVRSKAGREDRKLAAQKLRKRGRKNHFCTQNHGAGAVASIRWLDSWPATGPILANRSPSSSPGNPRLHTTLGGRIDHRLSCGTGRAFLIRVRSIDIDYATPAADPVSEPRIGRSVSLDHAAQLLGVSRRTIYNRIRDGRLQTIRTVGGSQRVLLDSVKGWRMLPSDRREPV